MKNKQKTLLVEASRVGTARRSNNNARMWTRASHPQYNSHTGVADLKKIVKKNCQGVGRQCPHTGVVSPCVELNRKPGREPGRGDKKKTLPLRNYPVYPNISPTISPITSKLTNLLMIKGKKNKALNIVLNALQELCKYDYLKKRATRRKLVLRNIKKTKIPQRTDFGFNIFRNTVLKKDTRVKPSATRADETKIHRRLKTADARVLLSARVLSPSARESRSDCNRLDPTRSPQRIGLDPTWSPQRIGLDPTWSPQRIGLDIVAQRLQRKNDGKRRVGNDQQPTRNFNPLRKCSKKIRLPIFFKSATPLPNFKDARVLINRINLKVEKIKNLQKRRLKIYPARVLVKSFRRTSNRGVAFQHPASGNIVKKNMYFLKLNFKVSQCFQPGRISRPQGETIAQSRGVVPGSPVTTPVCGHRRLKNTDARVLLRSDSRHAQVGRQFFSRLSTHGREKNCHRVLKLTLKGGRILNCHPGVLGVDTRAFKKSKRPSLIQAPVSKIRPGLKQVTPGLGSKRSEQRQRSVNAGGNDNARVWTQASQDRRRPGVVAKQVVGKKKILKSQEKEHITRTILFSAINSIKPTFYLRKVRARRKNFQVPCILTPQRQMTLALNWIVEGAKLKKKKTPTKLFYKCLSEEILDCLKQDSYAKKKRDLLHRAVESNRSLAHRRWW